MSIEDRQAAIRRFCELQHRVTRDVYRYVYPADCFCGRREELDGYTSSMWINEGMAIEWIERLVDAELRRHRFKRYAVDVLRRAADAVLARVETALGLEVEG